MLEWSHDLERFFEHMRRSFIIFRLVRFSHKLNLLFPCCDYSVHTLDTEQVEAIQAASKRRLTLIEVFFDLRSHIHTTLFPFLLYQHHGSQGYAGTGKTIVAALVAKVCVMLFCFTQITTFIVLSCSCQHCFFLSLCSAFAFAITFSPSSSYGLWCVLVGFSCVQALILLW